VEEIEAKLPELPEARRDRFVADYKLPVSNANLLTGSKEMADYEEDFIALGKTSTIPVPEIAKLGSTWLLGEVSHITNTANIDIGKFREKIGPDKLLNLAITNSKGDINTITAKSVLEEMFNTGKSADDIVREKGLSQISDTGAIEQAVVQVINSNPQAVSDYRAGKETAIKFLVGQVMKATRGRANPQMVNELLKKKLAGE
jgi:aspartyl-tRNA(Asn)/glutamyl-tRNA(Gln) amidotransferase subunit B